MPYAPVYPDSGNRNNQYNNNYYNNHSNDVQENEPLNGIDKDLEFQLRKGFFIKVMGMVAIMIGPLFPLTFAICSIDPARSFFLSPVGFGISLFCGILFSLIYCVLSCYFRDSDFLKRPTVCFTFLFVLSGLQTLGLAHVLARAAAESILFAGGLTVVLVTILCAIAYYSPIDLTFPLQVACLILMIPMFIMGLLALFSTPMLHLLFYPLQILGLVLSSFMLITSIQMVCNNQENLLTYGIDDVFFACLDIYVEIIAIFRHILAMQEGLPEGAQAACDCATKALLDD
eukprot:GDKJ01020935.1.p1 GENE.GDKJ01020935.1~~GDKJ01020935.1.p1  ORF type:complete len:287 (-),score=61.62 GDKJ01020935.1:155-1015(-)